MRHYYQLQRLGKCAKVLESCRSTYHIQLQRVSIDYGTSSPEKDKITCVLHCFMPISHREMRIERRHWDCSLSYPMANPTHVYYSLIMAGKTPLIETPSWIKSLANGSLNRVLRSKFLLIPTPSSALCPQVGCWVTQGSAVPSRSKWRSC